MHSTIRFRVFFTPLSHIVSGHWMNRFLASLKRISECMKVIITGSSYDRSVWILPPFSYIYTMTHPLTHISLSLYPLFNTFKRVTFLRLLAFPGSSSHPLNMTRCFLSLLFSTRWPFILIAILLYMCCLSFTVD